MRTQNTFAINAKTCTLNNNEQEGGGIILDGTKYVVPIYQRPYSWRENEISRFISDIFASYWGPKDGIKESPTLEPMFIGTMQLTAKNGSNIQEVIDGQQRLTTLLVLIKVLKVMFTENVMLGNLSLNWISTKVDSGKQQEYLNEFIEAKLFIHKSHSNPYFKRSYLVKTYLDEHIIEDGNIISNFNIDEFLNYLISNIYFVVIETNAGLSKTLQIFDAINTSGLDLNGGDIFKIRMYEYLKRQQSNDEGIFEEISYLYKKTDEYNTRMDKDITDKRNKIDIKDILDIYQYILIARHKLPRELYSYSVNKFYEILFDTLLAVKVHDKFDVKKIGKVKLSIEDLDKIIEVRFYWEERWLTRNDFTLEDVSTYYLIWRSRYVRYWKLAFVTLFALEEREEKHENIRKGNWARTCYFMRQLNKLFFIYSVRFQKYKSEIYHGFMHELISSIIEKPFYDTMSLLNNKIGIKEDHRGYYDLSKLLTENLTENAKRKNLICRLSAMKEELDFLESNNMRTNAEAIKNISYELFESKLDIEHIQSINDEDEHTRMKVHEEWNMKINSLGNLMILEQDINRSISNKDYAHKRLNYQNSKFQIVRKQKENYEYWSLTNSINREEQELNKILNYLFDKS